jgi:hypothetical protein
LGVMALTHLKSLPLAYTVRSWLLLRGLIKRAKQRNLEPDGTAYINDKIRYTQF